MFDFKNLTPNGKLVRLRNFDVVLDISEKKDGFYDVDKVYQLDGTVVQDGDLVGSEKFNSKLMDALYDDIDRGRYWEV